MRRAALIPVLCALMAVAMAAAERPVFLRGVRTVVVVVEPLPSALAASRLTKDALRAALERKLTSTLTLGSSALDATIRVSVNAVPVQSTTRGRTTAVAYNVALSVEQTATLVGRGVTMPVTTWRRSGVGVIDLRRAGDAIRDQLDEYADMLLKDLADANGSR
jgi:hypothetical protein